MPFDVALQQFSGPLQLLLELIEAEKLPITEISLAHVTDAYLQHLNTHEVPTEELADFLVVATRLLYIKSRTILPLLPQEDEEASDLSAQLRMYQVFVGAARQMEELFLSPAHMFERERAPLDRAPVFLPPTNVRAELLRETFLSVLKRLEPFFALRESSLERVISVQQRMEEIRSAILERSRLTFRDMVQGARSKVDVVVSFLALLELVKQRAVSVIQDDAFQDIVMRHPENV